MRWGGRGRGVKKELKDDFPRGNFINTDRSFRKSRFGIVLVDFTK